MMKFVAVLALALVAVSASEYFKQPKYPCALKMKIAGYEDEKKAGEYNVEINGRFFKLEWKDEDGDKGAAYLARPDLGKDGKISVFVADEDYCYVEDEEIEVVVEYFIGSYPNAFFYGIDAKNWDHKKSETWRGKKCDHYYDDDYKDEGIYVYDDYIYGVVDDDVEIVFEYEWKAPMEDFVMSKKDYPNCVKQEKKVADVPSEDYIMCAASSLKVAFVALIATLLVALF